MHALSLFERKNDGAIVFVLAGHINFDLIAFLNGQVALSVTEFFRGDLAFRLEAHADENGLAVDAHDFTLDDLAFFEVAHFGGDVTFQKFFEAHFSVDLVFHVFGSCHCTDPPT